MVTRLLLHPATLSHLRLKAMDSLSTEDPVPCLHRVSDDSYISSIQSSTDRFKAPTPASHFAQPPAPYGAPNMAPYGQMPQSAGGFGRGSQPQAPYMGAPQHGGYGANAYGGYQG